MAFNPTMVGALGGAAGMAKALMEGNSQFGDEQKKMQQMQQMMAMRGGQPPAAPMNIQPPAQMAQMQPVSPNAVPGGLGMQGMQPFPQNGAPPVNLDPMTKALFSPIPGAGGQ